MVVTTASDDDLIGLKSAYEQLQSLDVLWEYGPLHAYQNSDLALSLWRDTINPAVAFVQKSERKVADGTHVAEAPSPWHAYFFLRAQQQYVFRGGRPLGAALDPTDKRPGDHLFFRGQRCATWDFTSSLRRRDAAFQAVEMRAVAALVEYFRLTCASIDDVADNAGRCFAQHYGIATDLIDVSCEPDVAVWFATHPMDKRCPEGEGASVRSVSWAGQKGAAESVILLPPPFVRNVYLQRGLFLDASGVGGALRGRLKLDVRFPRETAGGEFQVIRSGRALDVWPDLDSAEKELLRWARSVAERCPTQVAVSGEVREQRKKDALPGFWLEKEIYDFEAQAEAWLSILEWVLPATCVIALPVEGASAPMRYEVSSSKVRALVRSNSGFFRAFVDAVGDIESSPTFKHSQFEVLKQILLIAMEELKSSGK